MQPRDKTSPYQQWVVSSGRLCSAVDERRVLQLKPGSVFTSTSVVAVDNVSTANQHLWFFDYIPHQRVSLKFVCFFVIISNEDLKLTQNYNHAVVNRLSWLS